MNAIKEIIDDLEKRKDENEHNKNFHKLVKSMYDGDLKSFESATKNPHFTNGLKNFSKKFLERLGKTDVRNKMSLLLNNVEVSVKTIDELVEKIERQKKQIQKIRDTNILLNLMGTISLFFKIRF